MKYIIILLFFSINLFSFNSIKDLQNEDGSFGSTEKEILTSVVLLAFLAHGETPTSKEYGNLVKNSLVYLDSKVKELCQDDEISFKHAYALWSLSEAYAMTGIAVLEESVENLSKHIFKYCNEEKWVSVEKSDYTHFNHVLSFAFYTARTCGIKATDGFNLTTMMQSVIQNAQALSNMDRHDIAVLKLIQLRWQIDTKDLYFAPCLKEEYSDAELFLIADLMSRLDGDSKLRKKAFIEAGNLSSGLKALLIKKLSTSGVVELSEAAKDLQRAMQLSLNLENSNVLFDECKNSPFHMLSKTIVYYFEGGEEWKNWNTKFSRHLTALQKPDGTWPNDLEVPNFIKLNDKEKKLFNSAFASLNLTVYYRYLPGFKPPFRPKPVQIEEGLDLIE